MDLARIPCKVKPTSNAFGMIKVKGRIDDYAIEKMFIMPMGNGELFLPVKAALRKHLKKQAGDMVKVILYKDESEFEVPEVFMTCLRDDPEAVKHFDTFSTREKKQYIDWINRALKEQTQIDRMAIAINCIAKGLRFEETGH